MKLNKWGIAAGLVALVLLFCIPFYTGTRRIRVRRHRFGRDRHPGGERRQTLVRTHRPTRRARK